MRIKHKLVVVVLWFAEKNKSCPAVYSLYAKLSEVTRFDFLLFVTNPSNTQLIDLHVSVTAFWFLAIIENICYSYINCRLQWFEAVFFNPQPGVVSFTTWRLNHPDAKLTFLRSLVRSLLLVTVQFVACCITCILFQSRGGSRSLKLWADPGYELWRIGNRFTSKRRRALAKAPTSSLREKMQEITSDFLLVSSSRYMEPLLLCGRETR